MSNDFQYLYMYELTRQIIKNEINANDIVWIKSVNFIAKKNTDRIKLDAINHLSQSNYLVLSSHIPIENSIVSNISLWFFWGGFSITKNNRLGVQKDNHHCMIAYIFVRILFIIKCNFGIFFGINCIYSRIDCI